MRSPCYRSKRERAYLHFPLLQQKPCRRHRKTRCDPEKRRRAWIMQGSSPWHALGRGVRLVVVVFGSVDERRRRAPTSSSDDERCIISPPDHIVRHLNWDGSFLGTQTKHGTLRLKKKQPFLFLFLSWTGKIGQSAI